MTEPIDLSAISYVDTAGRELTLRQLVEHWDWHVARLVSDLSANVDEDHAWGIEDYLATLYARSRLAGGVASASEPARAALVTAAAASDDTFRGITEPDPEGAVLRFAEETAEQNEWWWARRPTSGEPRRQLDRWAARDELGRP